MKAWKQHFLFIRAHVTVSEEKAGHFSLSSPGSCLTIFHPTGSTPDLCSTHKFKPPGVIGKGFHLTTIQLAQRLKRLPPMRETWVQSLGQEDPLEKEMVTHSSILAWRIPWTEKPGRLQSMGLQRVGHDWAISLSFFLSAVSQKSDTWTSAPPSPSFSSCPLFSLLVSHCRVVGPDKFGTQGDEIQPTEMHQTNQGSVG